MINLPVKQAFNCLILMLSAILMAMSLMVSIIFSLFGSSFTFIGKEFKHAGVYGPVFFFEGKPWKNPISKDTGPLFVPPGRTEKI